MAYTAQQLVQGGYPGYNGWGDAEANADFAATKGAGKGGGSSSSGSSSDPSSGVISAVTQNLNLPPVYETANPFSFDEQLARDASTKEYSDYYQGLLTDYTSAAERTKSRSAEDLKKSLDFLSSGKDAFLGQTRLTLDRAIRSSNEGYAGKNLYFSGARGKTNKETTQDSATSVNNYMKNYDYQATGQTTANERTAQDTNTAVGNYTRDINRDQTAAIEGGVLQRKGEAIDQYGIAKQKYYANTPAFYYNLYGAS